MSEWRRQQENEEQQQFEDFAAQQAYQSELKELLDYDACTGIFMWKKKRKGIKVGKPLGSCNGRGYLRITVSGKSEYAHRLAWLYVYGAWPSKTVDHINGNRSDNRIENLRLASYSENNQNKKYAQSNSNSKALGVCWHKKANKWQAHICVDGKRKYLGLYAEKEVAEQAYINAKRELHPFNTL